MFKYKIHPLILFALFMTSIASFFIARKSYSNQDISSGVIYTLFFIITLGLAILGFISNKMLENKNK